MKKLIFPWMLLLSVLTGCIYDEGPDCENETAGETYLALRSSSITFPTANGEPESITLNTLRIIVFSQATGRVVTNKVFDISDHEQPTADNGWVVDFSDIVVETKPGMSIVYAILNEDVSAVSGKSLAGELNRLSTLTDMNTLVNTPLAYDTPLMVEYESDEVTPKEPPFVMSTFGECDIPEGRTAADPYLADLRGPSEGQSGFELDRTMAKVTIASVSNHPMYEGQTVDTVATSYIFILKMGLVNVPMYYLWSPNRPQSSTVPPVYTDSYQEIDFLLENSETGYYDRTWNGSITATATANVVWRQYGVSNIYKIANNAGVNSYGLVPPNTPYQFDINENPNINNGNFLDYLRTYFSEGAGELFDVGDITFSNTVITPVINGAFWELDAVKDVSFYVPEHILSDKTDPASATKLYVKASIASMTELNPDNVNFSEDSVNWVKDNQGEILWTYPSTTNIDSLITNAFIRQPVPGSTTKVYHVWDGSQFYREARGTINVTLINPKFDHITNGNIKEFYLPIQNAPQDPADYNIYRNHEYRFSVHAIEAWGQTLSRVATGDNIVLQME
ncbi:MAG TPA: hypothetical protein PL097_02120 [Dysgonamonadaceae bacterium]|nr:hypothetical protein [Dysgonamonadaceae bacterium]HRS41493.1 hypothetical protein [Dysgonamonadaceae bacterium]